MITQINGKIYCEQHWVKIKEKNQKKVIDWTDEMEKYSKDKTVIDLKQILRDKCLKVGCTKKELVSRIINNK